MCMTCEHHKPGGGEDLTAIVGAIAIAGLAAATYRVLEAIWPLYLTALIALATWVYIIAPARRAAHKRRKHHHEHEHDDRHGVDVDSHQAPPAAVDVDQAAAVDQSASGGWLGPADIDRAIEHGQIRDHLNSPYRRQLDRRDGA